ncbi:MAG: recombination protein RecR, partial [Verrucomicrobia bacterium]|nr:recombination protein RecR [Verrucomicrobiota bacterium]
MSDMFNLPPAIQELKSALNKLPNIGPRSAERIALHI